MVATPTFVAPLGDKLTGDAVRSAGDSRIASSHGPLWGIYGPLLDEEPSSTRYIYELVADNMSMIVHEAKLSFLRDIEEVKGVGGTSKHIWLLTSRRELPSGDLVIRLYDLSPVDFHVRQEEIIARGRHPEGVQASGVDGDNDVVSVGLLYEDQNVPGGNRGELTQYNAQTFSSVRSINTGEQWPRYIASDNGGVWVGWYGPLDPFRGIRQYTGTLTFVADYEYPLVGDGHTPGALGGGSKRIYHITSVQEENATDDWPAGRYIHTIKSSTMAIVRSYGPMEGDPNKRPQRVGGM